MMILFVFQTNSRTMPEGCRIRPNKDSCSEAQSLLPRPPWKTRLLMWSNFTRTSAPKWLHVAVPPILDVLPRHTRSCPRQGTTLPTTGRVRFLASPVSSSSVLWPSSIIHSSTPLLPLGAPGKRRKRMSPRASGTLMPILTQMIMGSQRLLLTGKKMRNTSAAWGDLLLYIYKCHFSAQLNGRCLFWLWVSFQVPERGRKDPGLD